MIRGEAGYCIDYGHVWSRWSIWQAYTRGSTSLWPPDERPCKIEFKAMRTRLCRRCGCVEREDKSGNREIVRDPHGIEEYRNNG